MSSWAPAPPSSSQKRRISAAFRGFGDLRLHAPALILFAICAAAALGAFFWLGARAEQRRRAAFNGEAASVASSLRSALERPLELLEVTGTLFEASNEVTRSAFGSFAKPTLERHPAVRALQWIPVVPRWSRARFETAARADGLVGYEFRQHAPNGEMVTAIERDEYLPVFYMEPGDPRALGFDCASDEERRSTAERARTSGRIAASGRIRLFDDPPSVSSIVAFRPVYDPKRPRSAASVLGFTCEAFRVRAVAEHAIEDSLRRGLKVALYDSAAAPDQQLLFDGGAAVAGDAPPGLRFESPLRYADRNWRLVLTTSASYGKELAGSAWLALVSGLGGGALLASGISGVRLFRRLRRQVRSAQTLDE